MSPTTQRTVSPAETFNRSPGSSAMSVTCSGAGIKPMRALHEGIDLHRVHEAGEIGLDLGGLFAASDLLRRASVPAHAHHFSSTGFNCPGKGKGRRRLDDLAYGLAPSSKLTIFAGRIGAASSAMSG
ncbi:MAG: hypothetical protein R3C54_01945 [Parvularculaceae bacterium]